MGYLQYLHTIWLEARMPFVMKDFETGEFANYKNVEFHSEFGLANITDTSKTLNNQPEPIYATNKFEIIKEIGDLINNGNICKIIYIKKNDTFFFKVGLVPKFAGFYSINLGYNPGGTAHGGQVIDIGEKKCKHELATLCQSINGGNSTLQRAKDKGFKVWISPQPTKLEYWNYDNRSYFFTVVP